MGVLELLTTQKIVGINSNIKAELLLEERQSVDENAFVEIRIWCVPRRVRGSGHYYKYALAFVVDEICVLRYDDEAGKGDHIHRGGDELAYEFTTPEQLLADFWMDVEGSGS